MSAPGHHRVILPERLDREGFEQFRRALAEGIATGLPLLMCGAAPGVFCTGLDLERQQVDLDCTQNFAALLTRVWQAPAPTIALVDGPAIGGGLGLAAACDRLICTPSARFALPELLWGFVPAMIWPVVTTRLAESTARWWMITGHARSAAEAAADGLVDEVVEPAQLATVIARRVRECRRSDASAIPMLRQLAAPRVVNEIAAGAALTAKQLASPRVQQRLTAYARGEAPWE
jgi:enoyl-CoA hydratase/carnithine racemase